MLTCNSSSLSVVSIDDTVFLRPQSTAKADSVSLICALLMAVMVQSIVMSKDRSEGRGSPGSVVVDSLFSVSKNMDGNSGISTRALVEA